MRYLPKSDRERAQMLAAIGVNRLDDLFACIPPEICFSGPLEIPGPLSEPEILCFFRDRAAENAASYTSFLGAGVYNHFRPVVVDTLLSRGEFFTAYTPYQAEISQGTLQAIFEFQTLICQLTGQEVANASMYDGSTALAEAVMMAVRLNRRDRVLLARSVHPEYRQVVATYARHQGLSCEEIPFLEMGQVDLGRLEGVFDDRVSAIAIQSPNFFGNIENVAEVARLAHARGALLIVVVAEAVSLGLLRPPAEADIVALEGQSFGLPPSYGGPFVGAIATKERFVRQMPGRLAGQTTDAQGRRGFVLTLATREQHIRREKATSNICTNQALCALAVTIFLSTLGKQGLRELALQNLAKAHYLAGALKQIPGTRSPFSGPRFHEFVVETDRDPREINESVLEQKIIGGLDLGRFYPELKNAMLLCATETTSRADMDRFLAAFRAALT